MVNKNLFIILLILSILTILYSIREKWYLTDNISDQEILQEENNSSSLTTLTLTHKRYTEGLLEGQLYSFFGTGDLASRNLSENQVKNIILEQISQRDTKDYHNIETNLVRTQRWAYNKKWFVGKS